ncbi:nuclear transport factor 2 family protein [Flavobacterium sp. MK4S-17]|uniref:nuclear transport factor 2 family protein n=1 Tax=Flavobacterium sp. MK4S-17 TaxID=2543737 RepID=UPI00135C1D50|nr:nuclear transport factor 2 family protein [Flavobacterium sp. MK4S-17]
MEKLIDKWLNAWTSHGNGEQAKTLALFYAEDCFYKDPANGKGLRGRKNIQEYFTKLLAANPEWVWSREELLPAGQTYVLKWKARIPVNDEVLTIEGLDILEFDEGLITRNEVYFDRYEWMLKLKK